MAYTRYEIRGKLLRVLERIPDIVTIADMPDLLQSLIDLRTIQREFSHNPYEYVAEATRDEHKQLAQVIVNALAFLTDMLHNAKQIFESGLSSYAADLRLVEMRKQLLEETGGESATSKILAALFCRGDLGSSDTSDTDGGNGQEETETSSDTSDS